MAVKDLTIEEFDTVVEEYRNRKLGEVNDATRARALAEEARDAALKESTVLTGQVSALREELAQLKETVAQRKADWEASVKRIQEQLEKREGATKEGEDHLKAEQQALRESQDKNKHQWTLLYEAVENLKEKLAKQFALYQGWQADVLKGLPSGIDPSVPEVPPPVQQG